MRSSTSSNSIAREVSWAQLVPALTVGLITGIVETMLAISFAALIFSGPLSPFLPAGIGIALVGAILCGVVIALLTSVPGIVSGNQDVPTAIIAVAAASLASALPAGAASRALFVNVVVLVGLSTILTGAFFFVLARFRLGNLVRFLPYPVVGGFLAATGWVLLFGGIGIMIDITPSLENASLLLQPDQLLRWLPGLLFGVALLVILNKIQHVLVLPATVFGTVALFYIVAIMSGLSSATLATDGWLLGPFPSGALWQPLGLADLGLVHWPAILAQAPSIATVMLMSTIALLLNASGLELALGKDISPNRELRAAGVGNILAGAVGGLVGFQQLSLSVMNHRAGANNRLAGLFAAAVCLLTILIGATVLSLFPKLVLGGLVCFLGLSFLQDTLVENWATLPRTDYVLIVLILLVAITAGFMEAVGAGILVAVLLFIFKYSRIDVVRNDLTGRTLQSRVTRSPEKRRALDALGEQIAVLRLQGYIFFGTADSLLARIRSRLDDDHRPAPAYLVLDFQHVTGIDSTALLSFVKLLNLAQERQLALVFSGPGPILQQRLAEHQGGATVQLFPDLDRALEWCEDQLLASHTAHPIVGSPFREELARQVSSPALAAQLLSYFERCEVATGEYLMRQGDDSDTLYLMESGQMTAYLQEKNGSLVRLQMMRDWNVLGEIGFFLGSRRTASVVAEAPAVVYCLSRDALAGMEETDPHLASVLHRLIVKLLSERVVHLVSVVDALHR